MDEWSRLASHGDRFLWIDTGVVPLKSLAPMFALLDEEELFIVNHDDRTRKPFRNVNFTHSTALDRLKATAADALGEHMCSCLIGCRLTASSGMYFREAYLYSRDEQISNWPKHLSDEERSRINLPKKTLEIQRAQFERLSPEELMQVPLERVVAVYEYWGHRQDQSIFSILAYRYGARALSAVMYCYSSDASSYASKKNWESQGEWAGIERGAAIPEEARHAYTFHHRGTYASLAGLRRRAAGSGILGRRLPTLAHEQSALQQDILQQDTVGDHVAVEELVGPFGRRRRAHVHEAEIVATLLAKREAGSVMIDVGAHTGSALAPFVAKGWLVFAFEPDNANRLKLLERLANSSKGNQVTIDTRCVGDRSHSGLAFFTSANGGVSGLSSFDESHVQTQVVDVVSLTEFFADRDLPEVDFLKISTEGHELFVLKGFPWSRGRPEVIECSFDDQKTVPLGYNFSDVAQFLIDHGYEVFLSEWHPITPHETTSDWHCLLRYPCELSNEKAWGNLLAFRVRETAAELPAAFRKNLVLRAGQRDQRFPPKRIGSQQGFAEGTLTLGVTTFEGGGEFEAVDARTWRYQRSKENADLWLSSIKPDFDTVGCSFVGSVRLLSDCDVSVEVALGRHGSTPWEGRGRTVQLTAGREVRIKLTHHFERAHQGIRLQVRVKTPSVSACLLQLDRVAINETVESFRRRNGLSEPSFAHANRLYRAGDYMAALFTYLPLSTRDHHHHVVTDNLLLAAWKLGWPRELPTHELQYVLNL